LSSHKQVAHKQTLIESFGQSIMLHTRVIIR